MSEPERQDQTNEEIVSQWAEGCLSTGYEEVIDAYAADEFIGYAAGLPDPDHGPEELKQTLAMFRTGFPDLTSEILDSCAERDTVAVRWVSRGTHEGEFLSVEPTGRQIEFEGMEFARVEGGKVVESHVVWDALGLLDQLDSLSPTGADGVEDRGQDGVKR